MNHQQFGNLLRHYIKLEHQTQVRAAAHWGVSAQFGSGVVRGKKTPTGAMLDEFGMEKVIEFRFKRPLEGELL